MSRSNHPPLNKSGRFALGWTLLLSAGLAATIACDSPDPAAEDPFQQLAKGPQNSGGGSDRPDQPPPPANGEGQPGGGEGEGAPIGAPSTPDPREFVEISGSVTINGWEQPIQIDFVESNMPGPEGRPRLTLVRQPTPGEFTVSVLKNAGPVEINIYLDADGDGPGQNDIMLAYPESPIQVGAEAMKDLAIILDKDGPAPPAKDGAEDEGGPAKPPPPGEGDGGAAGANPQSPDAPQDAAQETEANSDEANPQSEPPAEQDAANEDAKPAAPEAEPQEAEPEEADQ